jgi:hydroxymethylbilane synthase
VDALRSIHQTDTAELLNAERKAVESFGGGCHQRYGAIALNYKDLHLIAIAGKDDEGKDVTDLLFNTSLSLNGKQLFSTTDFMSSFFSYEFLESSVSIEQQVVFVAHHRAVTDTLVNTLKSKRVWCSGTKTWQDLAAKGIWCEGCADGFGFSFLSDVFKTPLVSIEADKIHVLTNKQSAQTWKDIHVTVSATYGLVPNISEVVIEKLQQADAVFWTNFQQYEASQSFLKKELLHICAAGKTAELLIQWGIQPIVFPSIKSFNTWRKKNIG